MEDGAVDASYGSAKAPLNSQEQYKMEIRRLRSSSTFQLGILFTRVAEKPWKILWLPLSIMALLVKGIKKKFSPQSFLLDIDSHSMEAKQRNCVVMFPSDGAGMEHFTRTLAIAKKMKQSDPEMEIVFFTTMSTLHVLQDEGFPAYHLPNRKMFDGMSPSIWNSITEEFLESIFSLHCPSAFIFDGEYPYRGMLDVIMKRNDILRIWINDGSLKIEDLDDSSEYLAHFDVMIRPGDIIEPRPLDIAPRLSVVDTDPILLLNKDELLPRNQLRHQLGIPLDATVAYLQLSSDFVDNGRTQVPIILETLNEFDIWVVIGESIIGTRLELEPNDRIRTFRDFPDFRFFSAFDFMIHSGGYNSFHESVNCSLPSICIPDMEIEMGERSTRAKIVERVGCTIHITGLSNITMRNAVEHLMEKKNRELMWDAAVQLHLPNGSDQAARFILENMRKSTEQP